MMPPVEQLTKDGYDLQFGTNVVGHFYLTKLLLPVLSSTAKASPDGHVRVLSVSSSSHMFAKLNFNTFKDGPARKAVSPEGLYGQSKFVGIYTSIAVLVVTMMLTIFMKGNIVVATEVARRYGDQGIISVSLNPGTHDRHHVSTLNNIPIYLIDREYQN
jgi:NAD(P)-dependent dehydrogenase (short-subunit alcohol dehydrogenase family)